MTTLEQEQQKPTGLPLCPRCGAELEWGGNRATPSSLGCLLGLVVTLTKFVWLNLLLRPRCASCGKISKIEIISHAGRVPGIFWGWLIAALVGGALVVGTFAAFFMNTSRRR